MLFCVYRENRNGKIYELEVFKLKNRNASKYSSADVLPNTLSIQTELSCWSEWRHPNVNTVVPE